METTIKINIEDYLSEQEIKEIFVDEVRSQAAKFFANESNAQRLLINLSYNLIFEEVDKIIPNSRQVIIDKTIKEISNRDFNYMVFRDASYGSKCSLAYSYVEEAVKNQKELINQKVKETIENRDYSDEIWSKFEELGENFISNIYAIVELGRTKEPKSLPQQILSYSKS